jgi:hypothetical protein
LQGDVSCSEQESPEGNPGIKRQADSRLKKINISLINAKELSTI